jgi:uncharacterized membrane protein YebE (DUF533 family)
MEKLINTLFKSFEKIAERYDPTRDEAASRLERLKRLSKSKMPSTKKSALLSALGVGATGASLGALLAPKGKRLKASLLSGLGGAALGGLVGADASETRKEAIRDATARLKEPKGRLLRQLRLEALGDREEARRQHQANLIRETGRAARSIIHGY